MFENPVVSPFNTSDFINMVMNIYYTDIERYVVMRAREELFGVPEFEAKNMIDYKIEEIKNCLIQSGYHILYPNDITFEEASINKNLEINNNNLTKENKHLRHNISELQKQVNRLTEEKEVISVTIPQERIKILPSPDDARRIPWVERPSIFELYTGGDIDNVE